MEHNYLVFQKLFIFLKDEDPSGSVRIVGEFDAGKLRDRNNIGNGVLPHTVDMDQHIVVG
jgi:hypothetical protein